jgi:DNA polymerase-3 subunit delta
MAILQKNINIDNYLKNIKEAKIAGCLLYGPNILLNNFRFELIAKNIVPNLQDQFLVTNLNNQKIKEDQGVLLDEFFSIPMLGDRKLIIIRYPEKDSISALKTLFSTLNHNNQSANFILIYAQELDKESALRKIIEENPYFIAIPGYVEKESDIHHFVALELKKHQLTADNSTIKAIINNTGKNRQIISTELNKIATYLGENKTLNLFILQKLLGDNQTSSGENLVQNFVLDFAYKKYQLCLENINKIYAIHQEFIMLTRVLATYFTKLYFGKIAWQIHQKQLMQIALEEKVFYPMQEPFFQHLQQLNQQFINTTLQQLEELELNLKQTKLGQYLVFASFIRNLFNQNKT